MSSFHLTSIELSYGCHRGRFDLPLQPQPVVILGPNGAGKTTLMEALVLTLYGFDSRTETERMELRIPWRAEAFRATAVANTESGETLAVERDFKTQDVHVWRVGSGDEIFQGGADLGAGDAAASQYRRWLAGHLGLDERRDYENTAWVRQGELVRTRLGEHLLILAAGGHRDVSAARTVIEDGYYELTQEPLIQGHRRRLREGPLEQAELQIADLERRLAEARAAQERGRPIIAELDEVRQRLERLARDLEQLEAAVPTLSERRAIKAEHGALTARISWLEALERELSDANVRLESTRQAAAAFGSGPTTRTISESGSPVLEELWA